MATLLDQYYPFATGPGSNVTEAQWRQMAALWRLTGVVPAGESGLNELAVAQRAAGANMSVDVATGWAWIVGEFGALTTLENVGITANATGNPRIDLVVIRADFVNDVVELDVLVGTPAVAPVEPALTQNTSLWEIPLAAVDVAAAAASIVTANIRDRRTFTLAPPELANKEPVRAATTAALAASTVTGTTRVANANGALPAQDGVTLVAADRLLDKDHATTAQRGIWRVVDPGSASRPWILERPADFDSSSDVRAGVWIKVNEGTTLADSQWMLTTNDPIVLGTTGLTFAQTGPASWQVIGETVLTGTQANIDFAAIPATFRHLRLVVSARGTAALSSTDLMLRMNGDTGASYHWRRLTASGAAVATTVLSPANQIDCGLVPADTAPTGPNEFSIQTIDIANYAGAFRKQVLSEWGLRYGTGGTDFMRGSNWAEWSSASAITDLRLLLGSGSFAAGTVATLYGTKGA